MSGKHLNSQENGKVEESERVIMPMCWGLVPSWYKGDPKSIGYSTNNCRCEGMLQKPFFRKAFQKGQRCIVLADGLVCTPRTMHGIIGFSEWDIIYIHCKNIW